MKRIAFIPFFFLTIDGFTQNGIKPSSLCNSNIVKLELEIDSDLPLPVSRQGIMAIPRPDYVSLSVLKANCPVNFTKVYVSGKYIPTYSIYSKSRITLTGVTTKVNQIPGLYICSWGGSKIPTYYILTPVCENLLSL